MKPTYEEKRFANILNDISSALTQARVNKYHPLTESVGIVQSRVNATIKPVLDGKFRNHKKGAAKHETK